MRNVVEMKSYQGSGQAVYRKAKRYIPGGTQLLTKRPEMFLPELWPSYYKKANGVDVWDLDDRKYVDMSYCGIGACVLGFADPDVDEAVRKAIASGSMSTLNCPEEVELAELLCEIHPWANMVRYARCGGEAMAVAVRIARAGTGRDKVAFCGYHGWHDWYLSANLSEKDALDGHLLPGLKPAGVPRGLIGTAFPFRYNGIEELGSIASNHGDELAAIVMEPMRNHHPDPGFLEGVKEIAEKVGAVLIFDEITAGWRLNSGGVHLTLGVDPDMAVFAKALSNGYPMAAVIGIEEVMQAAQKSFISSTYWTERIGPAAALATIKKHQDAHVPAHLIKIGKRIQEGWKAAAEKADLPIHITGIPPLGHFSIELEDSQAKRTLFTQIMLQKGFLATNAFYATYAHNNSQVDDYLGAVEEAFSVLEQAEAGNNTERLLEGPVAHSGFMRLA